ncbi:unnamed protein product [Linum trigynum]|uniref:Uncharacterized protein n=1 Tax=Linum trigynum TaxID=586398 RepID=A0AAV2ETN8_9ROSI
MPFGLKNAGATYQRAMNAIFHDLIGELVEVYVDDIVVKSKLTSQHLYHLRMAILRMRGHNLKLNPLKRAFGVSAGHFLGFLVNQRGIEVDKSKTKAIIEAMRPSNKKELQWFLDQVNYIRRFILNCVGRTQVFSPLLKLKQEDEFVWRQEHQKAFDDIKNYLTTPPVLNSPIPHWPLKLYLSATNTSLACLLAQDNDSGHEQAVYYLSRLLNEAEQKYSPIEKLCLALYFSCMKLRYYLMPVQVQLICKTDIIKYMLSRPIIHGRISKWTLALSEFNLQYVPQKAIKGQALADFLANHLCVDVPAELVEIDMVEEASWTLYFDGSKTRSGAGAGMILTSPSGHAMHFSFTLDLPCTNNQAEYEALVVGLEMLVDLKVKTFNIQGTPNW